MRSLLTLVFGLLISSTAHAQCDSGEKKIRFGTWSDSDHQNRERAAKLLSESINKELQGKFCLEVLTDPQKFKGGLAATALQSNDVEMVAPSFTTLGTFSPVYKIFDLPFAFSNIRAVERFQAARYSDFIDAMAGNSLQPLAFWHGDFGQMSAKRPIYHPKEVAGLRFRKNSNSYFPEIISALYATAQSVAENDLTIAIQSDKINGQFTTWIHAEADGTAKILDGITETNHRFYGYQLLTSKKWWTELDAASKKSLIDTINRVSRQANFEATNRALSAKRTLIRSGIPVRALTTKQRLEWKQVFQSVWVDDPYAGKAEVMTAIDVANGQP